MKKFFIAVISLVIFAMVAYGIAYVVMPVNSIELNQYTHSVSFNCDNAYIVRDETVYSSDSDGMVYNLASDGDRVAQNSVVASVYNGNVNTDTLKKLRTIDLRINQLKSEGHNSELYQTDSHSPENDIADKMADVIELAKTNDVEKIHETKEDINSLRKGEESSTSARIEALDDERGKIESSVSAQKADIVSDKSGIFSSYIDGLESVLTPEKLETLTPKVLNSAKPKTSEYINGKIINAQTPVCKVMNNHVWYVAGITNKDYSKMLEKNPNVTVRFKDLTETDVSGEVTYISKPDKNGNCVFAIKVTTYAESAFSYRNINAEIVFTEYSGYRVPTDAIRTGEGIKDYYVYARKDSESYKCDIDILYSDSSEGYSIIQSKEGARNELGAMDRLIVGER